jgi:cytochrome c5
MWLVIWSVFIVNTGFAGSADSSDEYTIELYETYCLSCHGVEGVSAPIAFQENQWKQRLKAGMETLVNNAVTGLESMPAQGGCMECTYEDLEDIISYMSSSKKD